MWLTLNCNNKFYLIITIMNKESQAHHPQWHVPVCPSVAICHWQLLGSSVKNIVSIIISQPGNKTRASFN